MIIALDIDGTIRDVISRLNELYDYDFPNGIRSEVIETWELGNHYHIGDDIYEYAFETKGYELMSTAKPYIGAYEFVNNLSDHKIYFTTIQKNSRNKIATIEWLADNIDLCEGIFFSPERYLLNADILIDDYHVNLNKWAETGRIAICIKRPWNQDMGGWHNNVIFANNYNEILNLIKYYNEHPEELHESKKE